MPKKSSSYTKKIKVVSWYCFIKKECDEYQIEQLRKTIAETQKLKDSSEGATRTKYRNKLRNKENSLNTRLNSEFGAAQASELKAFIYEKDVKKYGTYSDGRSRSPFSDHHDKEWGRFVQGRDPSEKGYYTSTLEYMDNIYPCSSAAFNFGPQLIFSVFETHDYKSAVEAFVNCIAFTISENTLEQLDQSTGERVPNRISKTWASKLFNNLGFYGGLNLSAIPIKTRLDYAFETLSRIRSENSSENPFLAKEQLSCLKLAYYFIKAKYDGDIQGLAYGIFFEDILGDIQNGFGIRAQDWFDLEDSDEFSVLEQFIEARKYFKNTDHGIPSRVEYS